MNRTHLLLHLLPLLAAKGITTLQEAQAASPATYLARLRYLDPSS